MSFKGKYPFVMWFLQRSVLYYMVGILIVFYSVESYIGMYFRLKHLQQLCIVSDWKSPYDIINYYDYLTRIGLKTSDNYIELGKGYMLIHDQTEACKAFVHAKENLSSDSKEYLSISALCPESRK